MKVLALLLLLFTFHLSYSQTVCLPKSDVEKQMIEKERLKDTARLFNRAVDEINDYELKLYQRDTIIDNMREHIQLANMAINSSKLLYDNCSQQGALKDKSIKELTSRLKWVNTQKFGLGIIAITLATLLIIHK